MQKGQEVMPLVIAGGVSVTDYDGMQLAYLAHNSFTFAVNNSAWLWPCDVIVALDPDFIVKWAKELKEINKPIVTREWEVTKGLGLDLIEVRNDIQDRLSGMVACRLSDGLAASSGSRSYVIGMDHTAGHYYNEESDCSKVVPVDYYQNMKLDNTTNLGIHSKISCWPKMSKLPKVNRVAVSPAYRAVALAWVRGEARKICP